MFSNERGFSQVLIFVLVLLLGALSLIINQNLLNLSVLEHKTEDMTTDTIANTYDVLETTKVAIGDNIYEISPTSEILEDIYSIEEYLEFNKDFTVLTATLSTRYNNINYCILNGNKILDYRLDPKTQFVGFTIGEVDTTNPNMKAVTVPDYNYPNTSNLVPFTSEYSRNRLSFNTLNGVYALKYPQVYKTSNGSSEMSDLTTLSIALPTEFTDIIFFQSDLTHNAPTVLKDSASEILDVISQYPYVRITYNATKTLIQLSTNLTSIPSGTLNNTLSNTGLTVGIDMHDAHAYDISSGNSRLDYPTQNKFKFQAFDTLDLSNWHTSPKVYTMDFNGCIPRKITILRDGYYHIVNTTNSVKQLN